VGSVAIFSLLLTPAWIRCIILAIETILANGAMMDKSTTYYTPAEVAKQLRVTPEAVQTWCRAGRLQAIRAGRKWLITAEAVESFTKREQEVTIELNRLAVVSS